MYDVMRWFRLYAFDVAPLIKRRLELRWTQERLAKRVGVNKSEVSRVERGESQSLKVISRMAEALETQPRLVRTAAANH